MSWDEIEAEVRASFARQAMMAQLRVTMEHVGDREARLSMPYQPGNDLEGQRELMGHQDAGVARTGDRV